MQWQEVGILLALYSPIIVSSCTFHRLARVVLSRKSFCCVYCGKRPMEWKRKRGRTGRSRMNELLKSVKKERRKCNEDEKLCNVYTSLVDHRTTSCSHEKWIENVKRRVMYYICNRHTVWSNFVSRSCDFFFLLSIFLVPKILALRTYVTATVVWYNFHVHTLSVASMETWACVSIVSSSRARASRTYRSVSMNKRTKTRRCQK